MIASAHIDGGSRGNPGPASFAYIIHRQDLPDVEHGEAMGTATNNVAEYTALINCLDRAIELGVTNLTVFSDSELLVKQMNGEYKVKNEDMKVLVQEANELRRQIPSVTIQHVRREQNRRADELCNIALDAAEPKKPKPATTTAPKEPGKVVSDSTVRDEALIVLNSAANAWATHGLNTLPPAAVWEQLWSILEDGGVLKKKK